MLEWGLKNLKKTLLREKCPNTEFFLILIFLYSVRIQENTDQIKLRIWTPFTQYDRPNLQSCMALDVELFHAIKHVKLPDMS